MWLCAGVGAFVGFYVGRWWAEVFGARFNMSKTWQGRRNYRGK